jgi:ABC-2 type transport system permease protein
MADDAHADPRSAGTRLARTIAMGWAIHFKQESRNPFFLWILICTPLIYATMAYFLFRGGKDGPTLAAAAIGTAMMGIWSLTTTAAAAALHWRRRVGLLELLVAAPVPFWAVLAPITIAISAIGVYSIAASLLYTRLLFGVSLPIDDWVAFAVSVPASILAIGMLGFLLGAAFVRFRAAWAVGNLFEFPVWTICGLLIPIAVLPGWVEPVSWAFAPTWGMNALRDAALGDASPWNDVAMCVVLSVAYGTAGAVLLRVFLRSARRRGTLALT